MTYLQSLDKALDLFIEFKFCESDFYFLNKGKNCMVATYNFGSVYSVKMKCISDYFSSKSSKKAKHVVKVHLTTVP